MLSYFDIAIAVILIIAAAAGYIKGLYASAAGIVSFLLALYIASQFYMPAYALLNQEIGLQESLAAYIKAEYPVIETIESHAELLEQAAPVLELLLGSESPAGHGESLTNVPLSQFLSRNVLLALTFAGLYFLLRMLLAGLQWYLQQKKEKEGMGITLRAGGAIVEMLKSLVVILVLLAIFMPVIEVGALVEQKQALAASKALHESIFYPYFQPLISVIQMETGKNIF